MAAPTPLAAAANTYDEDAVIKARLFTAEERLYKRIQKRCATFLPPDLAPEAPSKPAAAAPTTTTATDPTAETDKSPPLSEAEKLRLEMEMDFTHFEAAIERVQLLHDANRKEISRYEESKESITRASIKARNDMATFHEDLRIAQETKRHKLVYDEIAREILSQSHLKSRSTQHENIKRLEAEIRELEKEKDDYGKVWTARRKQFDEIVAALTAMQMQIQEDKEEQERREALDEEGSEGEEVERKAGAGGGDDQKGLLAATGVLSGATTPAINMHEANTSAPTSVPQDISNADMKDANDTDAAGAAGAGAAAVAIATTPAAIDEGSGAVNNDTAMEDVPTTTADDDEDDGGLESGEHSEREEGQDDESMRSSRGSRRNSGTHSRSRSRSGTRSHTRSRTRSHSRSGSDRQYSDDEGEVTDHKDDSEGYASPQSRRDDDDDRASDRRGYGSRSEGEEDEEEGEERESDGGRRYEDEGSVERTPFSGSGPSSVPPVDSATDGDRTPREDSPGHTPVDTMDTT